MHDVVKEIDTCGLNCPMPLLKAKQALNSIKSGEQIKVVSTDQGSWKDFEVFARLSGNTLVDRNDDNGLYSFWLKKK